MRNRACGQAPFQCVLPEENAARRESFSVRCRRRPRNLPVVSSASPGVAIPMPRSAMFVRGSARCYRRGRMRLATTLSAATGPGRRSPAARADRRAGRSRGARARWRRPASDADFLRRVYLDLNGTIPDAATARAFLDDPTPDKRQALVDRLVGPAAVCPAHAARVRRDADGAAAAEEPARGRVERFGRRVAGVSAQEFCRQQAARSIGPRDPGGRRRRSGVAAGGQVLSRSRRRRQSAGPRHRPVVLRPRHAMCPVSRPSAGRRLPAGRLLRADGVRQPRRAVHDKTEKKVYYAENGRRRGELQIGVHRRRPRPRAAQAAAGRAA